MILTDTVKRPCEKGTPACVSMSDGKCVHGGVKRVSACLVLCCPLNVKEQNDDLIVQSVVAIKLVQ